MSLVKLVNYLWFFEKGREGRGGSVGGEEG